MYASPADYNSQSIALRRPIVMWLIASAGSIAVVLLIIGAPIALDSGHAFLGLSIYGAFSHVCHQIPERSLFIAGHQFAVCARCFGLYLGFTVATILYPLVRSLRRTEAPARKWLFLAAAPLTIDFAVGFLGIWENTHSSRFITGALLGAVSVFYVMPGLVDLSLREWGTRRRNSQTTAGNVSPAVGFATDVSLAPSDYSVPERRI